MKKRNFNSTKLNPLVDLGAALAFVIVMEEGFTGLRIHELLGLAIVAVLLTHILLHWRWIVSITKKFFVKLFHTSRLSYVLNLVLLVDMLISIVSGLLISKTLGLPFGRNGDGPLHMVHLVSSNLSLVLVGLHVGLHWKWIVTQGLKYLFPFRLPGRKSRSAKHVAITERSGSIMSSEGS